MRFASGVSISQDTGDALDEALRRSLTGISQAPDLLVCFATFHHGRSAPTVAGRLASATSMTGVSIGAISSGVIAGSEEFESGAALVVWAAWLDNASASAMRLVAFRTDEGIGIGGADPPENTKGILLLADPYSFPAGQFATSLGSVPVVGGVPGSLTEESMLFIDGQIFTNGAVAVALSGPVSFRVVVSPGGTPVGEPAIVTKAAGRVIEEIAGLPAVRFIEELIVRLDEASQKNAYNGVQIGVALDEYAENRGSGDYRIISVTAADRASGSILVGDEIFVGSTVQFHVRDPQAASGALNDAVAGLVGGGGMLMFSCSGRGRSFFDQPHHDASLVASACQPAALVGMISSAEIGPVAGTSYLHSYSAVVAEIGEP
ncbi:MAG: FIST C-terminal domain-containing protein [Acidimicrobiia bacterium]|nr:FIST C-terminal domain-containing protein [Acidimicrobiia bacterium]MDH5421326.1 FIST C-terminal domain-containing protein [Acidimicrobiia bacterium]MDH5504230.1 FIST C-terminal domain-containing protein [Acidimicrobiia bacterium]